MIGGPIHQLYLNLDCVTHSYEIFQIIAQKDETFYYGKEEFPTRGPIMEYHKQNITKEFARKIDKAEYEELKLEYAMKKFQNKGKIK